jgi:hypothetical protein
MSIRHRGAGKQSTHDEGHFAVTHNDTESSHQRRQRKEHMSVWIRVFCIVGIFALTSAVFSRRRRRNAPIIRTEDNVSKKHAESMRSLSGNPRFVTIVMPRLEKYAIVCIAGIACICKLLLILLRLISCIEV